jgi:hypothetical protein
MKVLKLILLVSIFAYEIQAQDTISIEGTIINYSSGETLYLNLTGHLFPLQVTAEGTFSFQGKVLESPSFFKLVSYSKRGKIKHQTPLIWFEGDQVTATIDWSDQSVQIQDPVTFQSTSEKIEGLPKSQRIKYILRHPDNFPSLYFANQLKEKISLSNLEKFTRETRQDYKSTAYFQRIDHYISAKKRSPLKKGKKIEDFNLPNKFGQEVSILEGSHQTTIIALFSSGCSFSIASIDLLEQVDKMKDDQTKLITI